jgi:hypothetical protein
MNLPNNNERAYLVGTWKGIYATLSSDTTRSWMRVGSFDEFPTVFAQRMQYEPVSDRLVVATMGRGIYAVTAATIKVNAVLHPGPVNCSLGNWESVGSCSASCGGGNQQYQRTILVSAMYGGTACPSLEQRTKYEPCNTHVCDVSRAVQMRLNVDLATASSATFQDTFLTKVSVALGIAKSRLEIVSVFSGSAYLVVNVLPDPASSSPNTAASALTAATVAQILTTQATNSSSTLVTSLASANIAVDVTYTPTVSTATWQKCSDGTWQTTCPTAPPPLPDYSTYLYMALGGLGFLFFCAMFCACVCYRKLHAAVDTDLQEKVAVQQQAPRPRIQTGDIQLTVNPLHRHQ